jgi:hypothetical protein
MIKDQQILILYHPVPSEIANLRKSQWGREVLLKVRSTEKRVEIDFQCLSWWSAKPHQSLKIIIYWISQKSPQVKIEFGN